VSAQALAAVSALASVQESANGAVIEIHTLTPTHVSTGAGDGCGVGAGVGNGVGRGVGGQMAPAASHTHGPVGAHAGEGNVKLGSDRVHNETDRDHGTNCQVLQWEPYLPSSIALQ
jgi:hypothetical protein